MLMHFLNRSLALNRSFPGTLERGSSSRDGGRGSSHYVGHSRREFRVKPVTMQPPVEAILNENRGRVWLSGNAIRQIVRFSLRLGLMRPERRRLLLHDIPSEVRVSLTSMSSPADQVFSDLAELNEYAMNGVAAYLVTWLENAVGLAEIAGTPSDHQGIVFLHSCLQALTRGPSTNRIEMHVKLFAHVDIDSLSTSKLQQALSKALGDSYEDVTILTVRRSSTLLEIGGFIYALWQLVTAFSGTRGSSLRESGWILRGFQFTHVKYRGDSTPAAIAAEQAAPRLRSFPQPTLSPHNSPHRGPFEAFLEGARESLASLLLPVRDEDMPEMMRAMPQAFLEGARESRASLLLPFREEGMPEMMWAMPQFIPHAASAWALGRNMADVWLVTQVLAESNSGPSRFVKRFVEGVNAHIMSPIRSLGATENSEDVIQAVWEELWGFELENWLKQEPLIRPLVWHIRLISSRTVINVSRKLRSFKRGFAYQHVSLDDVNLPVQISGIENTLLVKHELAVFFRSLTPRDLRIVEEFILGRSGPEIVRMLEGRDVGIHARVRRLIRRIEDILAS